MQYALGKHADLPGGAAGDGSAKTNQLDHPSSVIFARSDGRPFVTPPEAKGRVRICCKAFMDTMADKEFLAEAEKAKFRGHAGCRRTSLKAWSRDVLQHDAGAGPRGRGPRFDS